MPARLLPGAWHCRATLTLQPFSLRLKPCAPKPCGCWTVTARVPGMCSIWGTASHRMSIPSAFRCSSRRSRTTRYCRTNLGNVMLIGASIRPEGQPRGNWVFSFPRGSLPFLSQFIAQRAAQNLPDIGLGQLAAEVNMPRHFVARQFLAAEGDQCFRGELRIFLHDEQRDDFAGILVGL